MFTQILIGTAVGAAFGVLQIIVLRKVVKAVTEGTGSSMMMTLFAIIQFFAFVIILVLLGLYSMASVAAAGIAMVISGIIVWVILTNRQKKGQA